MKKYMLQAAAAAAVAVAALLFSMSRPQVIAVITDASAPLRVAWKQGQVYRYQLEYDSRQTLPIPTGNPDGSATPLEGHTRIVGELAIIPQRDDAGGARLRWKLGPLTEATVLLQGEHALTAEEVGSWTELESVVAVDEFGAVRSIHVPPGAPDIYTNLVQLLVGDLQLTLTTESRRGGTWTAAEDGIHGVATTRYRASSTGDITLTKSRDRYDSFRGPGWLDEPEHELSYDGRATLENDGTLRSISMREDLSASGGFVVATRASLTLASRAAAVADETRLAGLDAISLSDGPRAAVANRRALESQAGDITWEVIVGGVRGYSGPHPAFAEWAWKTTGYLQLHPEAVHELAALFHDGTLSHESRLLVLDMLVSAGHDQAQRALRDLLASESAQRDVRPHVQFLGRLSLLDEPTVETARFALGEMERLEGHPRTSAAYAVGSMVAKLPADAPERDALNSRLLEDLDGAQTPDQVATALNALSNAGRPDNFDAIARFARSDDAEVREAVAQALRKTPGDDANATLATLAADPSPSVQRRALAIARQHEEARGAGVLTHDVLGLVTEGRISPRNYQAVLSMLAGAPDTAARRAALDAMLARPLHDRALEGRIRALRDRSRS